MKMPFGQVIRMSVPNSGDEHKVSSVGRFSEPTEVGNLPTVTVGLRSLPRGPAEELLELTCYGVAALKVTTCYRPLVIAPASEEQVEEMLALVAAGPRRRESVVVLALSSGGQDGLVVCGSFTVFSHPAARAGEARIVSGPGSVLIARGSGDASGVASPSSGNPGG
jgi:hypothetical protein